MAISVLNIENIDTLGESLLSGKVAAADFASQLSDSAFVEKTRLANKPAETIETNSDAAIEFVVKFAPDVAKNDLAFETFLTANQIDSTDVVNNDVAFETFLTANEIASTDVLLAPSQTDSQLLAPTVARRFFPIIHPLNIIIGTPGNNILIGTNTTRDIIFGLDGNDLILGRGKNDFLFGGNGNDILLGGIGNDLLFGQNGNDILFNDAGSDILVGGAGNDSFFVLDASGSNQLIGDTGFDTANYSGLGQAITLKSTGIVTKGIGFGTDQLVQVEQIIATSSLNDWIDASDAISPTSVSVDLLNHSLIVNNVPGLGTLNFTVKNFENVRGTAQNDSITGNASNNILSGGAGDDVLGGSTGNDTLNGDAGIDTANYSALGQTIVLGTTGTVTKAGGGIDQLNGIETITASTLKGDTIDASAGTGSTSITANLAINSLTVNNVPFLGTLNFTVNNFENVTGTANNDTIIGNAGYNILRGGAGVDFLVGDAGNDTLTGGSGVDFLVGGVGNDEFTFSNPTEGLDFITDFVSGSDKIVVSASGFGGGLTQGLLAGGNFFVGGAATIGTHRFIYNNFTGGLFFDVDGNGAAVQQQIATLTSLPTLTFSDIQVIA
ncbi:MAG: calcium-binding protein [Gloeotrichia echinulata IR180]